MRTSGNYRLLNCMNANMPQHLSLPRAIGPYSITRSTAVMEVNSCGSILFGTFMERGSGEWTNIGAVTAFTASTGAINASGNAAVFTMPGIDNPTLGTATTLVPSAMTIQLMNPEALNTTKGIVYAGVMNQVPQIGDSTQSWTDFGKNFVSFNKPRLLSAGKICLSGVTADLCPMNMEALAHFSGIQGYKPTDIPGGTGAYTWDMEPANASSLAADPAGFAPFVVYNPDCVSLQFLVTTEYRLRFDISHPASSTHTFHRPASLATWSNVISGMTALGNGVKDIATVVANAGEARAAVSGAQLALGY